MLKKLIATTFLSATLAVPAMAAGASTSDSGAAAAPKVQMNDAGKGATTDTNGANTNATTGAQTNGAMNNAKSNGALNGANTNATATPGTATGTGMNTANTGVNLGAETTANNIIGSPVLDSQGNDIGEINDIVLSANGQIDKYVIDVGGFLGIGEKPVALTPEQVTFVADADGTMKASTMATKDELNNQPEYKSPEVPRATTPSK